MEMKTHYIEGTITKGSFAVCGVGGWLSATNAWSGVTCSACLEHRPEYPFYVNCGGLYTMQIVAARFRTALNPKTHKWQLISKTAQYKVVETGQVESEEYGVQKLADLYCSEDLQAIAKAKGLIY
jgi:hypothetical protein